METAYRNGQLKPGDKLPPVRSLAADLELSPATVSAAYGELRRRGIVTGSGRGGTRIRPAPPVTVRGYPQPPEGTRDLVTGAPDPDLLPPLPARQSGRAMRMYADDPVHPRLRTLAAAQLSADGVDPANIAVTGGALDAIERVLGTWLAPGDRVIVEDPGHAVTFDLVAAMGFIPVPVPVDDFGMQPDALRRALRADAKNAVIFTPRAQAATGAAWDADRAGELAAVLSQYPGLGVIEDDHAGPVAGTAGHTTTAARASWAHIRSVSKSLGPDLRLAVLAGDEETIARVSGRQSLGTGWVSYLLQETVADLWTDPDPIRRAASVYDSRRTALQRALREQGIPHTGRSGFTCWVPVADEGLVSAALIAEGWAVSPGRRFRIAAPPGVRICFARLHEDEAAPFAAALARACIGPQRTTPTRLD